MISALAGVAQLVRASSYRPIGHGFDSWSGHILRLRAQYPVGAQARGNQSMSLSLSLSLLLSLSLKAMKNALR